jgi:hypothetical protein
MMLWKISSIRFRGWVLFTLATGISWAVIIFPGFRMRDLQLSAWNMILPEMFSIFLGCAALGITVGFTQYVVLHFDSRISIWWLIVSLMSYAIGISLGFVIATTIIGAMSPQVLANTGTSFIMMPLAPTMLIGGTLAGFIQAYTLRKVFSVEKRGRKMLLWALGTALGWGFGFIISSLSWGWNLPIIVQSAMAGIMIGATSGLLLITCIRYQA